MTLRHFLLLFCALFCSFFASAQGIFNNEHEETVVINGQKVPVLIQGTDTIIMAVLDEVKIKGSRLFKNDKERYRYTQMRYNAKKVLPYVVEAVKLFQDVEADTRDMKAGKKRRRVNDIQRELQSRFEKPLKNLYRSQGLLLVKMIERETNRSLYNILDEYKGTLSALYWQTLSGFYEFNLREGYDPAQDPIMESVLQEFDVKALVAERRRQEAAAAAKPAAAPATPPAAAGH